MFIGQVVLSGLPASAQRRGVLTSTVLAAMLAGCGQSAAPPAAGAGAAPPPVEVGVVTVTQGSVGLMTELPGRTEASRVAQVRARVAGILQRPLFREGSEVKADQALFDELAATLRPAPGHKVLPLPQHINDPAFAAAAVAEFLALARNKEAPQS